MDKKKVKINNMKKKEKFFSLTEPYKFRPTEAKTSFDDQHGFAENLVQEKELTVLQKFRKNSLQDRMVNDKKLTKDDLEKMPYIEQVKLAQSIEKEHEALALQNATGLLENYPRFIQFIEQVIKIVRNCTLKRSFNKEPSQKMKSEDEKAGLKKMKSEDEKVKIIIATFFNFDDLCSPFPEIHGIFIDPSNFLTVERKCKPLILLKSLTEKNF